MKKPRLLWRAAIAVGVVYAGLFAGYAAAYLVLVEREYPRMGAFHWMFTASEPVPRYWVGGTTVYRVFAPVHSLDRRLRPDYWEPNRPGWLGRSAEGFRCEPTGRIAHPDGCVSSLQSTSSRISRWSSGKDRTPCRADPGSRYTTTRNTGSAVQMRSDSFSRRK